MDEYQIKAERLRVLVKMVELEKSGRFNGVSPFALLKIELGGIKGSRRGVVKYAQDRIDMLESIEFLEYAG